MNNLTMKVFLLKIRISEGTVSSTKVLLAAAEQKTSIFLMFRKLTPHLLLPPRRKNYREEWRNYIEWPAKSSGNALRCQKGEDKIPVIPSEEKANVSKDQLMASDEQEKSQDLSKRSEENGNSEVETRSESREEIKE